MMKKMGSQESEEDCKLNRDIIVGYAGATIGQSDVFALKFRRRKGKKKWRADITMFAVYPLCAISLMCH